MATKTGHGPSFPGSQISEVPARRSASKASIARWSTHNRACALSLRALPNHLQERRELCAEVGELAGERALARQRARQLGDPRALLGRHDVDAREQEDA